MGQPVHFEHSPYPFQIAGIKWLVEHKQALLADQMGLGKTMQAIIAMRVLFRRGDLRRTLVVCPASMSETWEREVSMWAPELRAIRMQGLPHDRRRLWHTPSEIYIVSYETLTRDIDEIGANQFDLYVLDEAQKIKNPTTKNHKAVKTLRSLYRWCLTGTPIENAVEDVIALFGVLKPELFDNGYVNGRSGRCSPDDVRRTIAPYMLRRTIAETQLELPELTHQDHWLELRTKQRKTYDAVERESVDELMRLGVDVTRVHILALITKLKQVCNYDVTSGQSCKLDFLQDELDVLVADNDKALVFSQYPNKTLKEIKPKLMKFKPLDFDGSMSARQRGTAISDFQDSQTSDVMLMSVKAGGVGITLTRANHVFHFDHWWNPATVDQASARVYRIGQRKPVFIHSLYTTNTIEERIFNLLKEKRQVFERVFGGKPEADDTDLQRLSDEDLYGLFGLQVPKKDHIPSSNRHRANDVRQS